VTVTTSTIIPTGGKITMIYNSAWAFTANSVCTISGLTPATGSTVIGNTNPTSAQTITLTNFADVSSGTTISISCTYLTGPSTAGNATVMVASYVTYDVLGNQINKWCTPDKTVNVTLVDVSPVGTSSDWAHTIAPSNISQTGVSGSFKFKLSQTLPKGSVVTIAYP
jgi:hypothetical protein